MCSCLSIMSLSSAGCSQMEMIDKHEQRLMKMYSQMQTSLSTQEQQVSHNIMDMYKQITNQMELQRFEECMLQSMFCEVNQEAVHVHFDKQRLALMDQTEHMLMVITPSLPLQSLMDCMDSTTVSTVHTVSPICQHIQSSPNCGGTVQLQDVTMDSINCSPESSLRVRSSKSGMSCYLSGTPHTTLDPDLICHERVPSVSPTGAPSLGLARVPSLNITRVPSESPYEAPSVSPVAVPSMSSVAVPSMSPVAVPSISPVAVPSTSPVAVPSVSPAVVPSMSPVAVPSVNPVAVPSASLIGVQSDNTYVLPGWYNRHASNSNRTHVFKEHKYIKMSSSDRPEVNVHTGMNIGGAESSTGGSSTCSTDSYPSESKSCHLPSPEDLTEHLNNTSELGGNTQQTDSDNMEYFLSREDMTSIISKFPMNIKMKRCHLGLLFPKPSTLTMGKTELMDWLKLCLKPADTHSSKQDTIREFAAKCRLSESRVKKFIATVEAKQRMKLVKATWKAECN